MSTSECPDNVSFSTASSSSPIPSPQPSPSQSTRRTIVNIDQDLGPEDDDTGDLSCVIGDSSTINWRQQSIQSFKSPNLLELFILSESGKPIYSYTTREDIVTLLPLCQALINCFQDSLKDTIRFITTKSGLKIIFSQRTPLIFVVVTHSFSGLDGNLLINQIHSQLVSVITEKTLKSVFEQRATFDLRRLLTGNDKMLHILIEQGFTCKPIICRIHDNPSMTKSPSQFSSSSASSLDDDRKTSPVQDIRRLSSCKDCSLTPVTHGYISSLAVPFASSKRSVNLHNPHQRSSSVGPHSTPNHQHNQHQYQHQQVNYHRSYASRALIPVYPLNQSIRDSITSAINSSISSVKSRIAFGLLLSVEPCDSESPSDQSTECNELPTAKLIAICNYNSKCSKLSPLDMQLIQCLAMASESQLKSVESLWLPLCLPRIDSSAFMHGHISYLTKQPELCLVLLTTDKEDFHNCQLVKDNLRDRLGKIKFTSPSFSELNLPCLQYFWYMTLRSQSIFRCNLPEFSSVIQLSPLIHFVTHRMLSSRLKIFWLRSDRHKVIILGWHSPSFQLYLQLEPTTTKSMGLNAAQSIIKWIKKEEDKLLLRDY